MNTKRIIQAVAALCVLVALLLALPAQADGSDGHTCSGLTEHINSGGSIIGEGVKSWYDSTCSQDDDDNDDDDDDEQATGDQVGGLPQAPRPPAVTCPFLPPRVSVSGYALNTQCQMVDGAGVGNMDVIKRGFIDAVDIWSYVNGDVEVCFRNYGSLVFLDSTYMPRRLMELEAYQRDGMTCGLIDRVGTVVLVSAGAPPAPAPAAAPAQPAEPAEPTLPTYDAIPLHDCMIKLQETLFLRATPGGEIIGLVWLYSEVPAFEINGYWYKIEFEGKTGYVSRYYRKVLRGDCG